MIEVINQDLWTYPATFRVVTTNGSVRRDGAAVMGRGCAKEAATRFPSLPYALGSSIQTRGNHVRFFAQYGLFTFPVKHKWMEDAELALIERSVGELLGLLHNGITVVMPRPGCGNGHLSYDVVRPLLLQLPDTVTVVTNGGD